MQTKKLLIGTTLFAGLAFSAFSTTACTVSVSVDCSGSTVDCNGECVDFSIDDNDCGGCGNVCPTGTYCDNGACSAGPAVCIASGGTCTFDGECCEDFCASDGACGCIMANDTSTYCSADVDCCDGACDEQTGLCN